MQTVTAEFEVKLDRAQAWAKLRDLSVPDRYVQGLTSVSFTTGQTEGVGASRRVVQGKSLKLDETVTEWREGEGFTLRLHRGDRGPLPPFKQHFFQYAIEQRGDKLLLVNRMHYQLGLGPLGRLLDWLFLRRFLAAQLRDVTLAQKLYYESGEAVGPRQLAEAREAIDR